MVKPVVAAVGIAVLVGGYALLRSGPPAVPPAHSPPTHGEAPATGGNRPAAATLPPAPIKDGPAEQPLVASTPQQQPDWIAYPDGTAYPPLNGVQKSPSIIWHRSMPFTKVVRVERDRQGRDWYVHENGVRSTTYLDGNGQAISDIAMQQPTMPILDDTVPK